MKRYKSEYAYNCASYHAERTPEQKEQSFKRHFKSYVRVISMLWVIWVFTGAGHMWPIYATIGWGIGLVSHALASFNYGYTEKRKELQRESEFI
jgi:2TM domain